MNQFIIILNVSPFLLQNFNQRKLFSHLFLNNISLVTPMPPVASYFFSLLSLLEESHQSKVIWMIQQLHVRTSLHCLPTSSSDLVIGQFGHCTQELMNLLLLGEAVSNVFDGDVPMDPTSTDPNSLKLKGAHHQSEIGYLTQLESLRYCQVGSYLKIPIYPIWVIGSQSHFTVLFSLNRFAHPLPF